MLLLLLHHSHLLLVVEHREVRLRQSAGGGGCPHSREIRIVLRLLLLLQVLLVIHPSVMLQRRATGPDLRRPVQGATALPVRPDLDPGDGRERRELRLGLPPPVERRRPPAGGGGGREGGVVSVSGRDVAAGQGRGGVVLGIRSMLLRMFATITLKIARYF